MLSRLVGLAAGLTVVAASPARGVATVPPGTPAAAPLAGVAAVDVPATYGRAARRPTQDKPEPRTERATERAAASAALGVPALDAQTAAALAGEGATAGAGDAAVVAGGAMPGVAGATAGAVGDASAAAEGASAELEGATVPAAGGARPREAGLVAVVPLAFRNGWFTIEGRSRRGPLRLVFDTGANEHGLTRSAVRHLGLPRVGWTRLQGGAGSEEAWLVQGPAIHFGNANARAGHRVLIDDDFATDPAGTPHDGVIGTGLLTRYDLLIDGPQREIRLYEAGLSPAGADAGLAPPIPMDDLGRSLIHFIARINGRDVRAILDTGAPYNVLNTAAALTAGVPLTGAPFSLAPRGIGSRTVGAVPTRIDELEIGATRLSLIDAVVSELTMFEALGLSEEPAMIVGAPVVAACQMLVSRARRTLSACHRPHDPPPQAVLAVASLPPSR